jgi:hypothetical protein
MRSFFTRKRLIIAAALIATAVVFWKPILAHASHFIRRHTFALEYAPGREHYIGCFSDTEIAAFGGRFGIDDLRRYANDPALSQAGRNRARDAASYYDYGLFAYDYINYHRRRVDDLAEKSPWHWVWPEYWGAVIKADYFAYLAEGAPQPPPTPVSVAPP